MTQKQYLCSRQVLDASVSAQESSDFLAADKWAKGKTLDIIAAFSFCKNRKHRSVSSCEYKHHYTKTYSVIIKTTRDCVQADI